MFGDTPLTEVFLKSDPRSPYYVAPETINMADEANSSASNTVPVSTYTFQPEPNRSVEYPYGAYSMPKSTIEPKKIGEEDRQVIERTYGKTNTSR